MSNFLIIGAGSGIGKAIADQLLTEGHSIYATFNSNPIVVTHPNLHVQQLNVLEELPALDFLPATLDGFVYCPGTIHLRPFNRIKPEEFVHDFNIQVTGCIKIIQAVLPRLKNATQASMVFFSSIAAQVGLNFHTQVAVSKAAIEGLTRSLAAELTPTIRVNCIAPSLTNTPLAAGLLNTDQKKEANAQRHPLKRIGEASDIANMATFLLSDKAGWITGQVMHVDGGMSAIKL